MSLLPRWYQFVFFRRGPRVLAVQLLVRPPGDHGRDRALDVALPFPIRGRVLLRGRRSLAGHVEEHREEPALLGRGGRPHQRRFEEDDQLRKDGLRGSVKGRVFKMIIALLTVEISL